MRVCCGAVGGEGGSGPLAQHWGQGAAGCGARGAAGSWCRLCRARPVQVVLAGWPFSGGDGAVVPLSLLVLGPFSLWFAAVGQLHQPFSALGGWDEVKRL